MVGCKSSDQRPTSQAFVHCRGQDLGKMAKTGQVHSNISSAYAKYYEGLPETEMVSLHTFISIIHNGENKLVSVVSITC